MTAMSHALATASHVACQLLLILSFAPCSAANMCRSGARVRDGDAFRVILMKPVNNVPIVDDGAEPPKGAVLLGYLVEVRICLSHSTCG